MEKKVFIGVGHGGSDPGAAANGFKEKDLNLAIALACNEELLRHGVKTRKNTSGKDYYGFIRQTKAPAVIVECAFVDNKADIKIIDTAAEQKAMGVAIAKGILKTLGIAYVPVAAQNGAGEANSTSLVVTIPVLKSGSKGGKVKALQAMLKGYGYGLGIWGVDGDFGAATVKAVQQYQKKNGLTADGIVGKATWAKLLGE